MPFLRPSLTEIIDRVIADISSRITGVDSAALRRSLIGILGRAEAGAAHLLYGYIDWVSRQVIIDTAEDEYLERWAAIWSIRRHQATFATGSVTFTGTNGSTIPDGTIVQRQDGVQYVTQGAQIIASGTAIATVQALDSGSFSNIDPGMSVFLLQPIAGVQSAATVAAGGISGGTDTERNDLLRMRLLERIRNPPQGGAETDYIQWALSVPGVTRVWVYPREMGPGTVTVRFVTDDDPGGIIPDANKVQEVFDYIETVRPVTAEVFVVAPVAEQLDMTIKISPNTPAVRAAVTAELADLISREATPGGTILISHLREAVSIAAGEQDSEIVSPTADVTHAASNIAVLGTITFQNL